MKSFCTSLVLLLAAVSTPAVSADPPAALTGWRAPQGIFLSWSRTPPGTWTVWRGTASGKLEPVATLPPSQAGFWDTSAARGQAFWYALGDRHGHGPELEMPGSAPSVRIVPALVTICSGLTPGAPYPADTHNRFDSSRDRNVQFYGLYLLRPFDPSVREVRISWRDPAGEVFSRYSHGVTPVRVETPDGPAGQLVLPQAIGLKEPITQNGQMRVPEAPGRYTVEVFIDDVPVALAAFYISEKAPAKPASVPATPAAMPRTPLPGGALP